MIAMLYQAETWVAVAFVLLLAIFGYAGVHRTILKALDHRADRIRNELDEARRLKEEAAQLVAEYRGKREAAEREAQEIVASAKADAERIAADTRTKMEELVARRTKMAEAKIAQAEAQALADVRAAAADAAASAAGTILAGAAKGNVAEKLISDGIAEVRKKLN